MSTMTRRNFIALAAAALGSTCFGSLAFAEDSTAAAIDAAAFDKIVEAAPLATEEAIAASEWASAIKKAGVMRVGGTRTSALFSQLNEVDGHIRGFDAGIYECLCRYILGDPYKFEITQIDSSTREAVLQGGQVDVVMATYSITPARDEVIDFAGPYYTSQQAILTLAGNKDIKGLDDLAGKVVATQAGSTGPAILEEYAPKAIVDEYGTDQEARQALELGYVDAYVTDYTLLLNAMSKNAGVYQIAGDVFGPNDEYGIGLPEGSDGVAFVNEFLKILVMDKTWAQLWQVCIGDRTGIDTPPTPPIETGDVAGDLKDGEFVGTGKGIGGKFEVTVVVKDGKVAEVKVGDNSETAGIGTKAIEKLPAAIVEANGTEGVEGISGASITSKAILNAVDAALEAAKA